MEFSSFPIPKSSENTRFTALLSQLPKLTIPLPLQPLETFTLFPRLPIDIRVEIWKLMSTQPRKVKLFFDISSASRAESRTIEGQSKIPVVLQINRESREEGLRFYTKCRESVEAKLVGHWINYIYINFEVDHFSHALPPGSAIGCNFNFGQEVLKRVKFVDANLYGMDEDRVVQFEYFVLAQFLILAESLVDFRFAITSNDYQMLACPGVQLQTVGGQLVARIWVKELLEDMCRFAVWYAGRGRQSPKFFPGGRQQSATKMVRDISAVFSEGLPNAAVWYHSLPDLDKLPRQEKQIKV
ncbi:hypothetical protein F5882DRAFT_517232 [Hyaloscypha sp. PMI_1271]|nr:hypothetical protein F5882DRAFT_517232 [Hyaloscypha sp. PMI_1271]